MAGARGQEGQLETLLALTESIRHDSPGVRVAALGQLLDLLRSRPLAVHTMLTPAAVPQQGPRLQQQGSRQLQAVEVARGLYEALLRCCAEADATRSEESLKIQSRSAQCLGLLGAADPSRLAIDLQPPLRLTQDEARLQYVLVVQHLLRVLRAASDLATVDTATYAIQEVLKLPLRFRDDLSEEEGWMGVDWEATRARGGQELLHWVEPSVREALEPYRRTKYILQQPRGRMDRGGPIFARGIPFRRWLLTWMRQMLEGRGNGSKSDLIRPCVGVMRHDQQTMLFLLPYLVLDRVIWGGEEDRAVVLRELRAVLEAARAGGVDHSLDSLDTATIVTHTLALQGPGMPLKTGRPSTSLVMAEPGRAPPPAAGDSALGPEAESVSQGSGGGVDGLASQAVFSLLDAIKISADQARIAIRSEVEG